MARGLNSGEHAHVSTHHGPKARARYSSASLREHLVGPVGSTRAVAEGGVWVGFCGDGPALRHVAVTVALDHNF